MKRYALVRGARTPEEVEAYLPSGYRVVHMLAVNEPWLMEFVIAGRDEAGWTLDGYVLPRLASGLIFGGEIDLSHPVMKEVPAS